MNDPTLPFYNEAANRHAALSASTSPILTGEHPAEEVLRSLCSWLGVGGYNAPTVDAKAFETKIRDGVTVYGQLHGMAARDLAEQVLHLDMVTDKGLRTKELARRVLGLLPLSAATGPTPTGWQPIETAPKDGRTLLLGHFNRNGKWRTLRGNWCSADTIAETWEEDAPEGWYETSVEHDDTPNCWWTEPTHWMPLPQPPVSAAMSAATGSPQQKDN